MRLREKMATNVSLGDASSEDFGEDSNIYRGEHVVKFQVCHCMVFSSVYLQDNLMSQNHWNYPALQNRIRNRPHSVKINSVHHAEEKEAEAAWSYSYGPI